MRRTAQLLLLLYLASGIAMSGCSSSPYRATPTPAIARSGAPAVSTGGEIAWRAISLLGSPYEWGAAGPTRFDCSGLVRYVHAQLGIAVPRTAAEQYLAAMPVDLSGLAPGDLLFFRIEGKRISHVAIYAGEGRFIHAPQTGRPVELRMLDDEFYRPRLAGAGRLFSH
jgi:murein DD-endopeptidase